MGFWQVHMETAVCDRLVLPTARLETLRRTGLLATEVILCGRCILQITRGPAGAACYRTPPRGSANEAPHRLAAQFRPSPRRLPGISNRFLSTSCGSRGPCVGRTVGPPVIVRGLAGSSSRTVGRRNPGASGSVNRSLRPDSGIQTGETADIHPQRPRKPVPWKIRARA
jgi:hypothetical protein